MNKTFKVNNKEKLTKKKNLKIEYILNIMDV